MATYRVTFTLWDEGTEEWRGETEYRVLAGAPEIAVGVALLTARHVLRNPPPIENYKVTRVEELAVLDQLFIAV